MEETLKDWLRNTLKELKTINSKEDGHVLRNTLKRHQNMMDGVVSPGQQPLTL